VAFLIFRRADLAKTEEKNMTNYEIKTDLKSMQVDEISKLLKQTAWAADRSKQAIEKSLENSICYGVFLKDSGVQIAFARLITDYATNYYLCDVVVDQKYRGMGIGKAMLSAVSKTEILKPLLGLLITEDAQTFYEPFGFHIDNICFMSKSGIQSKQ
jgi:GNAT superfamily N-acetyltransferase